MAFAIDVDAIVENAYGNIVTKSHPSGLLPAYEQYYDEAVTEELGFTYDADQAKQILADAGYADGDGDGFVETPDGQPIELSLIVPSGWTDWMEAARVIAEGLQAAGINATEEFPDSGAVDDARASGDFDLMLNNYAALSNTPWTYYNRLFYQPIQEQQLAGNYQRLDNPQAWELTNQLSRTPSDDPQFGQIMSQLQRISLEEMPVVPLWYNGLWAQYNEKVWTNWPKEGGDSTAYPSTWGGYFQMGGLETLANLEPAS
jgi:peptide/nickel transport system substrate-binding protein